MILLTQPLLHACYPHATAAHIGRYLDALNTGMNARAIDTPLRQAHFLAQIGVESGELQYSEEIADGSAYEGRADLGNTQPGDGRRFKGRGLVQLSGRFNYIAYGKALGRDLTHDEHWLLVATDPLLCVDVACWFWEMHSLNVCADQDDIVTITRKINGGLNGIERRKRLLVLAKKALGLSHSGK